MRHSEVVGRKGRDHHRHEGEYAVEGETEGLGEGVWGLQEFHRPNFSHVEVRVSAST